MTIHIGDKIPSLLVKRLTDTGVQDVNVASLFEGKKIVMFAVPGAFTPTCSVKHLPGYASQYTNFKALGVDVVCLAVNDPFTMHAWFESTKSQGITPLADGNGTFTRALGLEMDGGAYGMGLRAKRFALYAENGVIKALEIEKPGEFHVSSAEYMLEKIKSLQAKAA